MQETRPLESYDGGEGGPNQEVVLAWVERTGTAHRRRPRRDRTDGTLGGFRGVGPYAALRAPRRPELSDSLKILQAIHDYLPAHCAGSEIYTDRLSRALIARGHDVTLLFTEKRLERPQFERTTAAYQGIPFHEIVYNRHFFDVADLYDDPRMEAPIGDVLDEVRPDVLHVQSLVYLGLSLIRAAAARGIPIVMTLHEYFLVCPRGGLLFNLERELCDPIDPAICARCIEPYPMQRERYPDAVGAGYDGLGDLRHFARAIEVRTKRMLEGVRPVRRFVAPSAFLRDRLVRDGLPRERVVVSDYGFPAPPAIARTPRAPGAPLRLGYLGTLSDYKGLDVAVDAFLRLAPGRATLRIKGDPTWFPDFTAPLIARAAGRDDVAFEGPIAPTRAFEFLAEVDLLLVPSLWYENSPLTIHEAFQAGVPVVATDLGGMRELLEGGGGLCFRRGDAAALARVLDDLIDDPARVAALRATIPPVKSIEQDAEEMEALYVEVARER